MERVNISKEILNLVLNHLANRPYKEVAGIIKAVQEDLAANAEENSSES